MRHAPVGAITHPQRLAAVEAVESLPLFERDTQRALDRVVQIAARIFEGAECLVTLVDRQSLVVVAASAKRPFTSGDRAPLKSTLCRVVVESGEPLVVTDARSDERFRHTCDSLAPGVIAYAGVPLEFGGARVGTLALVDGAPRAWPASTIDTLSDLAESVVTELALRDAIRRERSFASLAEHLPDIVCRVDRSLRILYGNPIFAEVAGVSPQAAVGRPIATLMANVMGPQWQRDLERVIERNVSVTTTYDVAQSDDRRAWYEVRLIPERSDGAVVSVLSISRDITSEVESVRQLRDREAQLRAIFTQAIVGVFVVQDDRFVFANPRLATMLGFESPEGLLALPSVIDVVAPESRTHVVGLLTDSVRHGRDVGHFAFTGIRRDGTRVDLDAHSATVDVNGQVGMVGIIVDTTERNALEVRLRHAQKMEAVGQLASGVAHDFNNLLAAIVASAHLAMEDAQTGHASVEDLQSILDAATRAAELTRRLMTFGEPRQARLEVFELGSVIGGMEALLRRVLPGGWHLELLTTGDPLPLLADHAHLEQAVLNLVVNARDAMTSGGTVTVETAHAHHPELGDVAVLSVRDTGIGMDRLLQRRIFEPFFTTKERGRGTGLGLTSVHAAVEQARGRIVVESSPGEGTTVRIALPLATGHTLASRAAHAGGSRPDSPTAGAPPIVLLAEDEEAVRKTTKRMLERAGYHVLAARHGGDALRVLAEVSGIDLLVSDISMPEVDGVTLAKRARALVPGLPVVLMSGYTDMLTPETLSSLDAVFLAKPFSAEELVGAVGSKLATRRRLADAAG